MKMGGESNHRHSSITLVSAGSFPMMGARDIFDLSKDLIDLRGKVVLVTGGK